MTYPADVLDLSVWKLTLPVGRPEKPTEVKQPALNAYEHPDHFVALPDGGVRFRAPVNGVTTSGSRNPRCELRETRPDGANAAWSSSFGAHTLTVAAAVTRLPNPRTDGGNAGVVVAQIHNGRDDITTFRVDDGKVWVTRGDSARFALADPDYRLGARFEAWFVVWRDEIQAYYNGRLVAAILGEFSDCFFKAGCYTQANAGNSPPADASNYGESVIHSVVVAHRAVQPATPIPVGAPGPVTVPATPDPPAPPAQPPPTDDATTEEPARSVPTTDVDRNPLRKVALAVGGLTGIIGGLLSAGVLFGILSAAQADTIRTAAEQLPGWLVAVGALIPFLTGTASSLISAFGTAKVGERSVTPLIDPRSNTGAALVEAPGLTR